MFTIAYPSHPGAFIRDEIFIPEGLSITAAAEVLGVTRAALSALVNQRAGLSPEMALRLEKAFGLSMETMLNMQLAFDIAKARRLSKSIHVKKWSPPKRNGAPKRAVRQTKATRSVSR